MGSRGLPPLVHNLGIRWREVTPRGRVPGTQWTGGWIDSSLDILDKTSCPCLELKPGSSSPQPTQKTDYTIPAPSNTSWTLYYVRAYFYTISIPLHSKYSHFLVNLKPYSVLGNIKFRNDMKHKVPFQVKQIWVIDKNIKKCQNS